MSSQVIIALLLMPFNQKHPGRVKPTVIKRGRFICCCFLINLKLCKPVQFPFKFVDSSVCSILQRPPLPPLFMLCLLDSVVLSCCLQQSQGHVCFSFPLIPLLLRPVMSSGQQTRSDGTDTWKYIFLLNVQTLHVCTGSFFHFQM